ncbi:hypothetical protein LC065_01300 [Halobacillus litoralis]|uniref:hypothetical protein n=1 Tax=Halobacillus litoralis TaxID=45668 RepID=UPI001CFE8928|nr:hypothetical protein [Halobacillus litoralis]WLR47959.1 hypothetical protein LC065_01300 [Halobacillus litoralis]
MFFLNTKTVSHLYNVCPLCHGTGAYKEYDDSKANMIMDHYSRVNHASEKTAWKMAVEETSYSTECGRCHGNGHVLNDEGEEMYRALKQFA